ncbi:MAG: class I SAM-dependent methyltransferase, partial [Bdellovibrio sp.]|nr:class I SAM-dependent methyltransferase [Bdellovibrio sp.]
KNVLEASKPDFDFIAACNFSFFIFKERKILIDYFKAAKKSLRKDGILILEAAGGPGMIESIKERKVFKKDGKREFTYVWDQKSFDPVNNRGQYAIHFRLASGKVLEDAFEYDWRLWSIPELKDALLDAGFKSAEVYWESSHRDEGTGEYYRAQEGDNAYSWIAYIVGLS